MAAVFKVLRTEDPHCQSGEYRTKGEEKGRGDEKRREVETLLLERMRGKGNSSLSCHLQDSSFIILSLISCQCIESIYQLTQ
jgi:hypothetical protein